jgi:LysR family transcriptional regulator, cell division regulator
MIPSAEDLRFFLEAADKSNFSRAAESLGIAQPSLSLAVARVERSIGEDLFIRSKKGVCLTPAGKQLYAQAKYLVEVWEGVRSNAKSSMTEVQGNYVIGCHASVGCYALPDFLSDLLERFPKLNVNLVHDLSRRITEGVVASRVDVGIVVNPIRHPDLIVTRLGSDDVTFWCSASSPGRIEQLGRQDLIVHPELAQTASLLLQLRKLKLEPKRIVTTSSLEVIARVVASGTLVGILPSRVAATQGELLQRVRGAPIFRDTICLVRHSSSRKVAAVQAIASAVQSSFRIKSV